MAIPLGSCPTVGVAGYSLGGGESSLTPKFGYTCDSIVGLEVVTSDGKVLTATAKTNPDLFWAMRGAGANIGIATLLEFQLHPSKLFCQAALDIRFGRPKRYAFSRRLRTNNSIRVIPDCSCAADSGERMLDVKVVWMGKKEKGERLLHPLRTYLRPFEDTIKHKAYLDEQKDD